MSGAYSGSGQRQLMSVDAIAQELRYHPTTVTGLMREGKLKGIMLSGRWFASANDVEQFKATHAKFKHYTLEEEAAMLASGVELVKAISKKERSEDKMANKKVPWLSTEHINQRDTEDYLLDVRRPGGRGYGEITLNMACELESIKPGASKRFFCNTADDAKFLQSYVRDSTYLAGWFNEIPHDDRKNWVMWESHVNPGNKDGIPPHLTVVHLKERRPSKAVAIRKNKLEKIRKELGQQP